MPNPLSPKISQPLKMQMHSNSSTTSTARPLYCDSSPLESQALAGEPPFNVVEVASRRPIEDFSEQTWRKVKRIVATL